MRRSCRKLLAVLLALVLLASLCACAVTAPAEPSAPEGGGPSRQNEPSHSCAPPREPEPEPEEPKTPMDIIMDSYYLDKPLEIQSDETDVFALPGPVVGRVAPWYTTDTGGRETMEALLEKLQNGERLVDNLSEETSRTMQGTREPWGEALVYGEDGEVCGHVKVSFVSGEIMGTMDYSDAIEEFSPDFYRDDFRWPELLEAAIAEGKLDPDSAQLRTCEFVSFATGAVLYDDSREYFIPTNRTALHRVDFEVGTLYPMDELVEMLQNNIDVLFGYPPMNTGARG